MYTRAYYSVIKKEWNNDLYSNIDESRHYHTKWSKPDKDKHHVVLLICWFLEKKKKESERDTNELTYKTKETERHGKQPYCYQREKQGE